MHNEKELAVSYYCDGGKLDQAGRIHRWIAKGYEESNQIEEAINEYKLTLKYFKVRGATMNEQILMCERKIANLLSSIGNHEEASEFYQAVGLKELRSNLTKYNAHGSFFKSLLLLLPEIIKRGKPYDFSKVKDQMKWAMANDFRFKVSASCDFLHNIMLILSKKGNTLHVFIDHVYDYDSLYPLDSIYLKIMEEIVMNHYSDQLQECKNIDKMNLN